MARKFIIYGLLDPVSWMLRYVGKSMNGISRAHSHWKGRSLTLQDHCHHWVRSVLAKGLLPEVVVLEETTDALKLIELEIENIRFFSSIGCRLTNSTDGGEGAPGWIPSEETKRRIGDGNRGKVPSPEHRAKIGAIHRGRPKSPEQKAKMAAARAAWWARTKENPERFDRVKKNFSDAQLRRT